MNIQKRVSGLKQFRELAGLSQFQLSIRTGIPRDKLSRYECGYVELRDVEYHKAESAINEAIAEKQDRLNALRSKTCSAMASA